eukprot:1432192-Rhodomonas_salina.1
MEGVRVRSEGMRVKGAMSQYTAVRTHSAATPMLLPATTAPFPACQEEKKRGGAVGVGEYQK